MVTRVLDAAIAWQVPGGIVASSSAVPPQTSVASGATVAAVDWQTAKLRSSLDSTDRDADELQAAFDAPPTRRSGRP